MDDILASFLISMSERGLTPHNSGDIRADNKRHNYRLSGDPAHKKRGYYKLTIKGDFGYGFFGDYRDADCIPFISESSKKYTKEEIAEFKRKNEAARLEEERLQREAWENKAIEAAEYCLFLNPIQSHPYLTKKGIHGHGALENGNFLVIPAQDAGGKVWTYQTIDQSGEKRFLSGGRKKGAFYPIAGDESTVLIAEGFATGASLTQSTGFKCVVCFDAGNIDPVLSQLSKKYENILICGDNDWQGAVNTGKIKAEQAAKKYGVKYCIAPVDGMDGLTDFNDMHKAQGSDAVAQYIRQCLDRVAVCADGGGIHPKSVAQPAATVAQVDWQSLMITNKKGDPNPSSPTNLNLIMEHDEELDGVFKYDSFSKVMIMAKRPPWESEAEYRVRPIQDYDYFALECFLEQKWGLKTGKNRCADAILKVSNLPKNTFNPATEYFESLVWDGKPRLGDWLAKYVSNGSQNHEYLSVIGRKFMCGLAMRAMKPACKFDTMIILEGKQYGGKSFLSRLLGTINGEEYFLDDFKDIENKDALMKMQGKLVVEFPEISTLRKAEVNDLKAFITRQTDEFRPPYGRNVIVSPRQCVFIGTVNPEGAYLKDVTGNRRYWPIACRDRLPIDELRNVIPLLHAEAAHYARQGEQLWLNDRQYELASAEQEKRVVEDVWIDKIEEITSGVEQITADEILESLNIVMEKRNPIVYARVKNTMMRLGFEEARINAGRRRKRGYIRIPKAGDQYALPAKEEEISF